MDLSKSGSGSFFEKKAILFVKNVLEHIGIDCNLFLSVDNDISLYSSTFKEIKLTNYVIFGKILTF